MQAHALPPDWKPHAKGAMRSRDLMDEARRDLAEMLPRL